jgi:kinesin family protein 5
VGGEEIYSKSCNQLINKVINGYNGAIICFGQTGMGKTSTINAIVEQVGKQIFDEIEESADVNNLFKVEVAGFEIFKEQINDTLDLINLNLNLKGNKNKRIFVDNLTFFAVLDAEDFCEIVHKALSKRNNLSQSMKEYTSRCNNIIVVNIYRYSKQKKQLKTGCLYLVDLEGSEKMAKNKIEGESNEEKKLLNKSLQSLRHLVQTLDQIKTDSLTMSTYIPYRESKLTEILCDCFGGNCYTSVILNCCVSPLYF